MTYSLESEETFDNKDMFCDELAQKITEIYGSDFRMIKNKKNSNIYEFEFKFTKPRFFYEDIEIRDYYQLTDFVGREYSLLTPTILSQIKYVINFTKHLFEKNYTQNQDLIFMKKFKTWIVDKVLIMLVCWLNINWSFNGRRRRIFYDLLEKNINEYKYLKLNDILIPYTSNLYSEIENHRLSIKVNDTDDIPKRDQLMFLEQVEIDSKLYNIYLEDYKFSDNDYRLKIVDSETDLEITNQEDIEEYNIILIHYIG